MEQQELLEEIADHVRATAGATVVVVRLPDADGDVVSPRGAAVPAALLEALVAAADGRPSHDVAGEGATALHARAWMVGQRGGAVAWCAEGAGSEDAVGAVEALLVQAARTLEYARRARDAWDRVDELRRMNSVALSADERLRKELSLHLHGKVQTSLLAASFLLDRSLGVLEDDPEQATEILTDVREELDRVRDEEIREVSHLLHPSVIDVALTPALRALGGRYRDRFEVSVEVSGDFAALDRPGDNRLYPALRLTIYRLVEEALANAARHGRPRGATVELSVEDEDHVVVTVSDDGRGFDVGETSTGLGFGGVSYRVEDASGTWDIDSAPGEGTRVTARLPVERRARPRASSSTAPASRRSPVPPRPH